MRRTQQGNKLRTSTPLDQVEETVSKRKYEAHFVPKKLDSERRELLSKAQEEDNMRTHSAMKLYLQPKGEIPRAPSNHSASVFKYHRHNKSIQVLRDNSLD